MDTAQYAWRCADAPHPLGKQPCGIPAMSGRLIGWLVGWSACRSTWHTPRLPSPLARLARRSLAATPLCLLDHCSLAGSQPACSKRASKLANAGFLLALHKTCQTAHNGIKMFPRGRNRADAMRERHAMARIDGPARGTMYIAAPHHARPCQTMPDHAVSCVLLRRTI